MVKKGNAKKGGMKKSGQTAAVDDRFLDLAAHPMFKEMSSRKKKVPIDERFKEMLTDERFSEKPSKVDRRGRFIKSNAANNYLTKLYEFEGTDESKAKEKDADEDEDENDEKSSVASDIESREVRIDLARGEGNISSSSSSEEDEEEEEDDDNDNEIGAPKGYENDDLFEELEKDVTHVEWASTRLAICNMEWDSLCAEDIFLVLNSFTPDSGKIQSVSVYRSDFGVKYEEREKSGSGPASLNLNELDSGDKIQTSKKVRAYELDRLRCFYAICHCDSDATAIALYEACDGVEYEDSGVKFDLRFVPAEMDFPESRLRERATADDLNEKRLQKYKRKKFVSFALSNCKPKLSWDQQDPNRARFMQEAFKKETNLDEFSCLIASASESSDEDEGDVKDRVKKLLDAADDNQCAEMVEIADGEDEDDGIGMDANEGSEDEEGDEDEEMLAESGDAGELLDLLGGKRKKVDGKTPYKLYLERKKEKKREDREKFQQRKRQLRKEREKANAVAQLKSKKASANDSISAEPSVGKADGDKLIHSLEADERFNALFTDSSFAIEKTHTAYKGGDLADQQVRSKLKKRKTVKKSIAE